MNRRKLNDIVYDIEATMKVVSVCIDFGQYQQQGIDKFNKLKKLFTELKNDVIICWRCEGYGWINDGNKQDPRDDEDCPECGGCGVTYE